MSSIAIADVGVEGSMELLNVAGLEWDLGPV
jgi:hypothetical protein